MGLVSWAKKELARMKLQKPSRLLLPPPPPPHQTQTTLNTTSPKSVLPPQMSKMILAADLRCIKCQERVATTLSTIDKDVESIEVHVVQKKVTLTCKPIHAA